MWFSFQVLQNHSGDLSCSLLLNAKDICCNSQSSGFAECWDADAGPFALCSPYSVSSVLTTGVECGSAAGTAPQAEQDAARPVH